MSTAALSTRIASALTREGYAVKRQDRGYEVVLLISSASKGKFTSEGVATIAVDEDGAETLDRVTGARAYIARLVAGVA